MWNRVAPSICLLGTSFLWAQNNPAPMGSQNPRQSAVTPVVASEIVPAGNWDDPRLKMERAQIVNAVLERQIALRRDTEKLLFLAEELKKNVDKTNPNVLSMDVIKKAQEIEKLAKSVKDKMKEAY